MKLLLDEKRLIEQRKKLQITKFEASKRMHLTQSGYLRYESGERKPTYAIIMVMADALHTSPEYLTGQTDDPEPRTITVYREEDPELFEIAGGAANLSPSDKKKLLKQYHKMVDKDSAQE